MLYLRSALFFIWFAVVSIILNVGSVPFLIGPHGIMLRVAKLWAWLVLLGLKWFAGIKMEIRGTPPTQLCLIASKHCSMWETIALYALLPAPAMVLKESLLRIPFYGWYCRKMRMIAIDRSAGASAIRDMVGKAKRAIIAGRPVLIFPEGTRTEMDAPPDYKPGVAGLYTQLKLPCIPIAHNSGLYWAGFFLRKPGTIILEFMEPIPPGLPRRQFMALLQTRIEESANRLLAEGRQDMQTRGGGA